MKSLGLYIHVPFCDGKCNYCDFYSFKAAENEINNYTNVLIEQIRSWGLKLNNSLVDTIYFGGGTPSLLGTERLSIIMDAIRKCFKIAQECEITLEANPTSATNLNFSELKLKGFNRVSLGMQSAIDNELKLLGRRHIREDVINSIENIKASGIDNISLDVMLGIPEQTEKSLIETLDFCISMDIEHISTYMLTIEPDTVFGKFSHKYNFADDDTQAKLYTLTSEHLKNHGFEHYEISNFCKNRKISNHNMRYWELKEYLGLGPSAHSLIDGKRFYYPKSIEDFKDNRIIEDGTGKTPEEYIMLMLRTNKGVNASEYENLFNLKLTNNFYRKAQIYEKLGYIKIDDNSIRLTEKGFLLSNAIIAELI